MAIKNCDERKIFQLLDNPAVDTKYTRDDSGSTALILACKHGYTGVVERLLRSDVETDVTDAEGRTALWHACSNGNAAIVRLLLETGCSPHAVSCSGDQAIHEAASGGHAAIVKQLVDGGCDINRRNTVTGMAPLHLSVLHTQHEAVDMLLSCGADPNVRTDERETALHFAVQVGSGELVEILLKAGARVNHQNHLGETPLLTAVQEGKLTLTKLLVKYGAVMDVFTYISPLCSACQHNHQDIIKYLLSEGYNVSTDSSIHLFAYTKLEATNSELLNLLLMKFSNPATLMEISRVRLRQMFRGTEEKIRTLSLPDSLLTWVMADSIY
ncbi:hypothetical protein ScPMuIL_008040 [Solemya velum]